MRASRVRLFVGAVVCALAPWLWPPQARADTVVLTPVADNTMYRESDFATNGGGAHFFCGSNALGDPRRALMRFNLSSIPAGSTITSASLRLSVTRTRAGSMGCSLHRLTNSWGEGTSSPGGNEGQGISAGPGDSTWIYRFYDFDNPVLWSTPGGEFIAGASATTTVTGTGTNPVWTSAQMAADVQGWLDSPATNHGWILVGVESFAQTAKRFGSRNNTSASVRPQLTVVYTPPSGLGACCVPMSGCVQLSKMNCVMAGGMFQGVGVPCTPDPCPPPTGACCLPTGYCVQVSAADCATQSGEYHGDGTMCMDVSCPIQLTPYVDALPVPPIAQPTSGVPGGAAHYDLSIVEFTQQVHRDLPATTLWGYGGSFPGPTIEAHRDQPVTVRWVNDLRGPGGDLRETHYFPVDTCIHGPDMTGQTPVTTVHLHGGYVPPESDGFPMDAYPPGQSSGVIGYPNNQRACTMWYHDHAMGITRLNVYMGLAGMYVLRDAAEDALNLPRGEYEVPLVITDRSFNPDGSLRYMDMWHDHFFGDFVLVNGKVWPYMNVKQGKYRFRVLNGSNSRTYTLGLSNNAPITQIGSDGGLLSGPASAAKITLAPAERADVIIDFASYAPGTEILLANSAPAPYPGEPGVGVIPEVMKFVVVAGAGDTDPIPASLAPVPRIPEAEAAQHREFVLREMAGDPECEHPTMWAINDMMFDDLTEFPVYGTTEVWSWINRSPTMHPMHIHLVSFQVLDRQDFEVINDQVVPVGPRVAPAAGEMGWKDTVKAAPLQITRVIARFDGYAGRYVYHCHVLEHEDNEMMRQFEVCLPASAPTPAPAITRCYGESAQIAVEAAGTSLSYAWTRNGQPVVDGPTPWGSIVSGADTGTLGIDGITHGDAGTYVLHVENQCGSDDSEPVLFTVCVGDFNCSGGAPDDSDVAAFFAAWNAGDPTADVNGSGGTPDDADVARFFAVWSSGEC